MEGQSTDGRLPNIHPGEVLREEFLIPMGVSRNQLARDIGIPLSRVNVIVNDQRSVAADTALRLARYFGTSPMFWLALQGEYDLEEADLRLREELAEIAPLGSTGIETTLESRSTPGKTSRLGKE